ncbi:MAG: sulfite exporter TauE/SafE family protein [Elainellaceae cyanobacterium]
MVTELLLIAGLGFLGSFGHCVGMCGPIAVAASLSVANAEAKAAPEASHAPSHAATPWRILRFHGLLNLGRLLSYTLVGAGIGALGSVLVAGGQMAGIGSGLRQGIAIAMGLLLIWLGVVQLNPSLPRLPSLNPMRRGGLHQRLTALMQWLVQRASALTPLLVGSVWGLIPCGFLYTAQIKAAETASPWSGALVMAAFGLGTLPSMVGVGALSDRFSGDGTRRSQLFRLGGWLTILIGLLTLMRASGEHVDYAGHAALLCLVAALVARPIAHIWAAPLRYRRLLGVGAFVLSVVHVLQMVVHSWRWNLEAIAFMLPQHQVGIALGTLALALMTPLALTSFDWAQAAMGPWWRRLHLLSVPAFVLVAVHTALIGSHYLGRVQLSWVNAVLLSLLAVAVAAVLILRLPWSKRVFYKRRAHDEH